MNPICTRLKNLRKDLNMSQVEFSKRLGVTNAHISKIEKGGTIPSDALIKLIAKEYEVNEEWLKSGIDPIYKFEILEKTEEKLITSTDTFNQLLRSDSYIIRGIAADLELSFSSITYVNELNDEQKKEYLYILKKMFEIIDTYSFDIKDTLCTGQFTIKEIKKYQFINFKSEINKCIDELENLLKNYK